MNKLLVLAVAGLGFIGFAASDAAELVTPAPGNVPAAPTPAAPVAPDAGAHPPKLPRGDGTLAAMRQIPPTGAPILLEAGKGTLLRLSRPASTVFIANPDVADVQVKSPSLIYISAQDARRDRGLRGRRRRQRAAQRAGAGRPRPVAGCAARCNTLLPGENIGVNSVDKSLVLSGNVSTAGRAEKARTLAAPLTGNNKDQPSSTRWPVARRTRSICGSRSPR